MVAIWLSVALSHNLVGTWADRSLGTAGGSATVYSFDGRGRYVFSAEGSDRYRKASGSAFLGRTVGTYSCKDGKLTLHPSEMEMPHDGKIFRTEVKGMTELRIDWIDDNHIAIKHLDGRIDRYLRQSKAKS